MKRTLCCILAAIMLTGLWGCAQEQVETKKLWVVTEVSCSDGMNYQAEMIARRMEQANPGLTVELEILPTDPQEREARLTQLRTKIMSGAGPDVYLLPTGGTLTTDYVNEYHRRVTQTTQVEPLFLDVTQAMRSGQFLDISAYYESDDDLNTAALKREIMDAGTVHSRRYVLPLRFNIPVMFTDKDLWERFGLSEALLESDGLTLSQTLMENAGDDNIVTGLGLPADLSLLSQPFDYGAETLQITQQTIADYMRLYQRWRAAAVPGEQALVDTAIEAYLSGLDEIGLLVLEGPIRDMCQSIGVFNDLSQYISVDVHWSTGGFPLYSCTMAEALETLAVEKTYASIYGEERNLACYPFRDSAGCVTASVTYWGALGSGTKVPELGYAFLRQFLEEEFQWDQYRPREDTQKKQEIAEIQCHGQVENSWPVRTVGSAAALWETLRYQNRDTVYSKRKESNQVGAAARALQFRDEEIPALSWNIDEVRFPITITGTDSMESALSRLNMEDGTPTDVDIDELARQVYQGLWWHLAEG